VNGAPFVVGLNPIMTNEKKSFAELPPRRRRHSSRNPTRHPNACVNNAGAFEKSTIDQTISWTQCTVTEGQELLIVCHIEPTFARNYFSPELRLDHV
jgi:hypothetical protein